MELPTIGKTDFSVSSDNFCFRRAQRIDWEAESVASSVDGRTRTISDSIENDRMSRVERLLMQTIGRLESQDEQLKVLKNKLDLTENTNRFAR